jgi:hypothetical protein
MNTVKSLSQGPSIVTGVAAIAIFLLDLEMPNGVIDGVLYVLVVLLAARAPNPRAPLYAATALAPLMVLGFVFSPMAAPLWVAITNRAASVVVVWIAAGLMWRRSRACAADRVEPAEMPVPLAASVLDNLDLQLGIIEWRLQRLPYFVGRASDLKRETLILTSALKNARYSVTPAPHPPRRPPTSSSARHPHQTAAH